MQADAGGGATAAVAEPQLKYEELSGDVSDITSRSRVTCLCLSDKILAIGTDEGKLHVLDYSGHEVRSMALHQGPVNELSFDKDGEHIASCSDDCTVVITNLYTDVRQRYVFKHPIKTLALDPRYASRRTKEYVAAGSSGQVQLSTQGWIGRSEHTLYEGQVQLVRWSNALSGSVVAWGSERMVSIYDTNSHLQIRTITRYPPSKRASRGGAAVPQGKARGTGGGAAPPEPVPGRWPDQPRLSLLFGQDSKVYISWPDCIKVARIFTMENNIGGSALQVEIMTEFYTHYLVLGVSPFGKDLAVLTYPAASDDPDPALTASAPQPAPPASAPPAAAPGVKGGSPPAPKAAQQAVAQDGKPGTAAAAAAGKVPLAAAPSPAGSQAAAAVAAAAGKVPLAAAPSPSGTQAAAAAGKVLLAAAPPPPPQPGCRPQLRIISTSNQLLAEDELPVQFYDRCGPSDYLLVPSLPATTAEATSTKMKLGHGHQQDPALQALDHHQHQAAAAAATGAADAERPFQAFRAVEEESLYFIVTPQSILVSRTRDTNDHVLWLLGQGQFEEALGIAEVDRSVQPDTYEKVVQGYIDDLLRRESYETAAQLSPRLLKDNGSLWERWVYLFAQIRQLPKLAPFIPTDSPRLRDTAYEMVIRSLLLDPQDNPTLLNLVRSWPPGLVSMPLLVDLVAARMKRPGGDNETLWRLLSLLYQRQGRPDLSLSILIQLRSADVFDFIETHSLVGELLGGRAATLLDINEAAALKLLTRNFEVLPPTSVVPGIRDAMDSATGRGAEDEAEVWRHRLYRYLAGVLQLDATAAADYHELQVQLTADYAPSKLMDFLSASQHYPLEAALAICERRDMVTEQVYILGRMGNSRQALHLIIEKLGDIPQAIAFARSQRDDELWDYLITWALGSSETTGSLLDHVGGCINPLTLIQRLPKGLSVPRLRDRIRTIIGDFRTQSSLHEGCSVILRSDCMGLMSRLYAEARRAMQQCYVEWRERGAGQMQWHRYNTLTGQFEHVPLHSMPAAMLASAPGREGGGGGGGGAGPPRLPAPSRLWIGFNVEDAATHIKLASKEESVAGKGASRAAGRSAAGSRGGKRGAKIGADVEEEEDVAPQSHGPTLPSLIR